MTAAQLSAPVKLRTRESAGATDVVLRRIALHGVSVKVSGPRMLQRTVDLVLRGFPEAPLDYPSDFAVRAARVPGNRTAWTISSGERRHTASPGVATAALWTEWVLTAELVQRWPRFVHVHAGLVANDRQSVLLVGRSGSGKSTTTSALALRGLLVYSDDVALVDPTTMRPLCVPRPIKLDTKARKLLRSRGLVIPHGSWIGESIDRTVIPGFPPVTEPGPPVTAAVFFADERQERPNLRRITGAEAVMRLIMQSASERFDAGGPSAAATALVNAVRCYELAAGGLDDTVQVLQDLLDGSADV